MTPDTLKTLSVKIVQDHFDRKAPVDKGIASAAKEDHLNNEEIKRLIETCNTLLYLKLHGIKKDKTFEFPLASYTSIKKALLSPHSSGIEKAGSFEERKASIWDFLSTAPMEKEAATDTATSPATPLEGADAIHFYHMMEQKLEMQGGDLLTKVAAAYSEVKLLKSKDANFEDKLAFLGANGFTKAASASYYVEKDLSEAKALFQKLASLRTELGTYLRNKKDWQQKRGALIPGALGLVGAAAVKTGKTFLTNPALAAVVGSTPKINPGDRVMNIIGAG